MKRRTFLVSTLAVGAAASSGWWISTRKVTPSLLADLVRRELPVDEDMMAIGHLYLDTRPDASVDSLSKALLDRITSCNARNLDAALREAVLNDFAIENITVLEGWILSTTELELCGLSLLLASE